MTQTINIKVPEGKIAKYNEFTHTIEFIDDIVRSKSWEDYCKNNPFNPKTYEYVIDSDACVHGVIRDYNRAYFNDRTMLSSEEDAKGIIALIQLIRLREEWIGDWEPDYTDDKHKYIVNIQDYDEIRCSQHNRIHKVLSFPTEEMCEEFIKCFEKLIMTAKKFI